MKKFCILMLMIIQLPLFSQGWSSFDRVIATVNSQPVIESQLETMYQITLNRMDSKKKLTKKQEQDLRNSVLDSLISEAILYQVADDESIIISDERVQLQINDMMKYNGFTDFDKFKKSVEKNEKMPYDLYVSEVKKQLTMEQLMVYAVDFVPPTEEDAKKWYNENKANLIQVRFQRILIAPKNDSFGEEKRANELAVELYNQINSGQSFDSLARRHSEDKDSARRGGIIGWTSFSEVDPDIAGYVYQMKERKLYPVFKTKRGYNVVRYYGTRSMPYEEIRDKIFQMMAQKARHEQFTLWVNEKRSTFDIHVFLEGYEYTQPENTQNQREEK